jgi:hypothetical protein
MEKIKILDKVFDGLMTRYKKRVPDVNKIINSMIDEGIIKGVNNIENDHVAFRTLKVKYLGITSLEKIFLYLGYKKMDYYYFESKKLNAYYYAPPLERFPRIFISELIVEKLPNLLQTIIKKYTDTVKFDFVDNLNLNNVYEIDNYLHSGMWNLPSLEDYKILEKGNEYAAWAINNHYFLNHFTIAVHNLEKYNNIESFNNFLEKIGIILNNAGGKIKISIDGLLKQSSTVAALMNLEFKNQQGEKINHQIPGSYVEFAERKVLPQFECLSKEKIKRIHRREGFETRNADKIFESTFSSQTHHK